MDTVKRPVDSAELYAKPGIGARSSWEMIQKAESGAVCSDGKLFVTGGGHADGAHNGMLALDTETWLWQRVIEPSP